MKRLRPFALLLSLLFLTGASSLSGLQPGAVATRYGVIKPPGIPRIDWTNPITAGLAGVWVLGNGPVRNLVTGEMAVQGGTLTPKPYIAGMESYFQGQDGTASNYYTVRNSKIIGGSLSWSVMAGAVITSGHTCNGTTNNGYDLYVERGTSGNDIIKLNVCAGGPPYLGPGTTYRNDAGTLVQPGYNTVSPNDNGFHIYAATKNGDGGSNNFIPYQDGAVPTGSCQHGCTLSWSTNDNFTDASVKATIGRDIANTNEGWPDGISFVYVWKTALTRTQVVSLSANPYQFLIFPQDVVFQSFFNGAGGGGSGVSGLMIGGFP